MAFLAAAAHRIGGDPPLKHRTPSPELRKVRTVDTTDETRSAVAERRVVIRLRVSRLYGAALDMTEKAER